MEEALEKAGGSAVLWMRGRLKFGDLFDMNDLQRIQDLFAKATGVAAIITAPEGIPITKPSNFGRLCPRYHPAVGDRRQELPDLRRAPRPV